MKKGRSFGLDVVEMCNGVLGLDMITGKPDRIVICSSKIYRSVN